MTVEADLAPSGSKTVAKALALLEMFSDGRSSLSVAELTRRSGMSKGAVLRLVVTLSESGYLARDAEGKVRLGVQVAILAAAYMRATPARERLLSALASISTDLECTAQVSVLNGDTAVVVLSSEPRTDLHVAAEWASKLPLGRTAAGRAILSVLEDPEAAILADTKSNPAKVRELVETVRSSGFSYSCGETNPNVWSIALPLGPEVLGQPASIAVVFPRFEDPSDDTVKRVVEVVDSAVKRHFPLSAV